MKRCLLTLMILATGFLLLTPALQAGGFPVPFQADYVDLSDADKTSGKYFAGPEGMRMEGIMDGEPQIMIINFVKNVTWVVMEEEGIYMEMPFNPEDSDVYTTPCPELSVSQTMVGKETLHGRSVEKWHCEKARGGVSKVWFDPRLKTAIRVEEDGSIFELQNIREGRLSSDLFQAPSGYTRMSMPGMHMGADPQEQEGGFFGGAFQGMDPDEHMEDDDSEGLLKELKGLFGR